ncbi:hypothetical protein MYAM1_002843 [Malassezia yamatoensis]|uniref:Histone deacetylation protein Rxt3 n=1 Tax=Malassezia yamatoensis TaxID=253288 RepID=A0AAJ5YUQ6_9BASI|nr:hypothetical protein MYAM1_002843 [Malassezia yamatoensis]
MTSYPRGPDLDETRHMYRDTASHTHATDEYRSGNRGPMSQEDPMRVSSMVSSNLSDVSRSVHLRNDMHWQSSDRNPNHAPQAAHVDPYAAPSRDHPHSRDAAEPSVWHPTTASPNANPMKRTSERRSPSRADRYSTEQVEPNASLFRGSWRRSPEPARYPPAYEDERRAIPRSNQEYAHAMRHGDPAYSSQHYPASQDMYHGPRMPSDRGGMCVQSPAHVHPHPHMLDDNEAAQSASNPRYHPVDVPHHHHLVTRHHHHHHHHHANPTRAQDIASPPRTVPWQEQTPAPVSDMRQSQHDPDLRRQLNQDARHAAVETKQRELASGPRVDSEPVWEYLDRCEQMEEYQRKRQKEQHAEEERQRHDSTPPPASSLKQPHHAVQASDARNWLGLGVGMDRGRAVRHLGSFVYDASGRSCLPAELLVENVGATIEVRICGRMIGAGISVDQWQATELQQQAAVLERIQQKAKEGVPPNLATLASEANEHAPEPLPNTPGRWHLGWRGLEHARMSRELRIANLWVEEQLRQQTNKRLHRTSREGSLASRLHLSAEKLAVPLPPNLDADKSAWEFWSQPSLSQRKLWGTDVYTDDSDVLAMCVHAGWIEAPHVPQVPEWLGGGGTSSVSKAWNQLCQREEHALGIERNASQPSIPRQESQLTCDLSVTLRIAPKLILYKGCHRGGIKSRSWGNSHDGVSLVVESVELRPSGYATGYSRKSAKSRINHMAQLRNVAKDAPVPRSVPVEQDSVQDHAPKLKLPNFLNEEQVGQHAFWQIKVPTS